MRFSWNEIIYDHDKWGAQRYPLFAYADGTGRVKVTTPAYEIGVDDQGHSLPDEAYPDGQMAKAAIEKLREFADDGTRFCLALGFYKPHLPFNAPKAYCDLYNPATLPAASPAGTPTGANPATTTNSGEINSYTDRDDRDLLRHAYFACVSYTDAQVGKVLAELDALGLADNTIVVLWGDHGWCLDDYGLIGKHKVLERSLESPLIIRPPRRPPPRGLRRRPGRGRGRNRSTSTRPSPNSAGSRPPASAVGTSLVPMLRNPFAPGKNHAYSRWGSLTTVRTSDWRLINTSGDYDLYDLSGVPLRTRRRLGRQPGRRQRPSAPTSTVRAPAPAPPTPPGPAATRCSPTRPATPTSTAAPTPSNTAPAPTPSTASSRPAGTLATEDLTGTRLRRPRARLQLHRRHHARRPHPAALHLHQPARLVLRPPRVPRRHRPRQQHRPPPLPPHQPRDPNASSASGPPPTDAN